MGKPRAEDLAAGVGVRIEVHETNGAVLPDAGTHVGLGDGMVAAQDHRDGAGGQHLFHHLPYGGVRTDGIGGQDGRVAVVDHAQAGKRVHPGLELRSRWAARRPDGARRKARSRPVGDELVHRGAHDGHVSAL